MTVQKQYIINVLYWLITNKFLYKNIKINHYLLNIQDNKFISSDITNIIINCDFNHYENLNYIANICKNNYKNNLYSTIVDIKIKRDYINSGYEYGTLMIKSKIQPYNYHQQLAILKL